VNETISTKAFCALMILKAYNVRSLLSM